MVATFKMNVYNKKKYRNNKKKKARTITDKRKILLAALLAVVALAAMILMLSLTNTDSVTGLDSVNDGIGAVGGVYVHPDP